MHNLSRLDTLNHMQTDMLHATRSKQRGSLVLGHQKVGIPDSAGLGQVQLARLLGRSWCLSLRLAFGCCWRLRLGLQLDGHVGLSGARLIT